MSEERFWLSTIQAAKYKNVSRQAVQAALADGRLDGIRMGRDWFVTTAALDSWEPRKKRQRRRRQR